MSEHSPTPWRPAPHHATDWDDPKVCHVVDDSGCQVARVLGVGNGDFVLTAVNYHARLVDALRSMVCCNDPTCVQSTPMGDALTFETAKKLLKELDA